MEIRPKYEYQQDVLKTFNLITWGKSKPILKGSNSIRLKYAGDYDLFSVIKSNESEAKLKSDIVKEFQKMGKNVKANKDHIYYMYFMCGVDAEGRHKKWTLNDMIAGRFKDNLDDRIKIEIVSYSNGVFMPYSDVFEFYSPKFKNVDQVTIDTLESLKPDIKKYHDDGNLMKVMKRLYIIAQIDKDFALQNKLIDLFDGDIAYVYSCISHLKTMVEVLDKYGDKTTIDRVYKASQLEKEKLGRQNTVKISPTIIKSFDGILKKKIAKSIIKEIEKINNKLMKIVNKEVEKYIKKHKISYSEYI